VSQLVPTVLGGDRRPVETRSGPVESSNSDSSWTKAIKMASAADEARLQNARDTIDCAYDTADTASHTASVASTPAGTVQS
jgi:hypothetical protein